jgi:hypothetical protein
MTRFLMEEWLYCLNRLMKRQQRKILLFLDNVPSHPKINFDSVKVAFFRPNVTSKSQSMDQGIIQATKLKFRKRQLQFMLSQMDKGESKTGTQILKDISVLDAIFWISRSWDEVEITTIEKCFAKAGFKVNSDMVSTDDERNINESDNDDDDDRPLELYKCLGIYLVVNSRSYVKLMKK